MTSKMTPFSNKVGLTSLLKQILIVIYAPIWSTYHWRKADSCVSFSSLVKRGTSIEMKPYHETL